MKISEICSSKILWHSVVWWCHHYLGDSHQLLSWLTGRAEAGFVVFVVRWDNIVVCSRPNEIRGLRSTTSRDHKLNLIFTGLKKKKKELIYQQLNSGICGLKQQRVKPSTIDFLQQTHQPLHSNNNCPKQQIQQNTKLVQISWSCEKLLSQCSISDLCADWKWKQNFLLKKSQVTGKT